MTAEFSIYIHEAPGTTVVDLIGELDVATAPELREVLKDLHGPLVFELRELTFIDGRGVGILARAAATNGGVTLQHPNDFIRRVLEICDMNELVQADSQG